ncbi:hypothetical protein MJD09_26345 [bacterium]|nr:hypothetical protein [bacterium]
MNISTHLSAFAGLVLLATLSPCTTPLPVTKISKTSLDYILEKSPAVWTVPECEKVISYFTAYNQKGYNQKRSDYSVRTEDVFIRATALNKYVIAARTRKESLNRRLPSKVFKKRLKVELEDYTNFTLHADSVKLVPKSVPLDSLLKEYSFLLYFENISLPHRNIEVYRAEEGFFLENEKGEFTRALDFWGLGVEENFVLLSDLKATITFSAVTDEGKEIVLNEENMKNYKLVFNGLQPDPIIVKL